MEKIEALGLQGLDTGDKPDIFDDFFKDHSIDIRTGELLGRYIAEEHDTARMAKICYDALCAVPAQDNVSGTAVAGLEAKVDSLCRAVEELRQIVCAQAMPATAG